MSTRPPSRVVFVGNIPYGLSEEQISEIFSRAGKVLNFRLVYDRETGKPKGFGFAEYPDSDSAASAVRNLNDTEIMGRKLRVDFSNEPGSSGNDDAGGGGSGGGGGPSYDYQGAANGANGGGGGAPSSHQHQQQQQQQSAALPPLPPGKDLPAGITATDAISRVLRTLKPAQLLDILQQMKTMASTDPARATELLAQAPQLAYAVFQALLLMDLVSPDAIHSVMDPSSVPVAAPPPSSYGAYPAPAANSTPPVIAPYAAPPPHPPAAAAPAPSAVAPAPTPAAAPGGGSQDADALVQQVMALPQAMIDQLPEMERAQIMQLRATFMAQGAR